MHLWRPLRPFLRPYRGPLSVGVALAVTQTILDLARPWPLKFAVDNAIQGHRLPRPLAPLDGWTSTGLAAVAAGAALVLVALSGFIGYLESYITGAATERVGADMRTALFGRLLALSPRFHDEQRSGDLATRLTSDVSRVQDALVAGFTTVLPEALMLVGMLVVLVVVDPVMALASLAVAPLLALVIARTKSRLRLAQRESRRRQGAVASRAVEILRHVRAVQVFNREPDERDRFSEDVREAAKASVTALDLSARYGPATDLVLSFGSAAVLLLGVVRVTSGHLSLGTLLVVLSYVSSLYGPIRSLARLAAQFSKSGASAERLVEILEAERLAEAPNARPCPPMEQVLSLDRVSFSYRPGTPVLDGVSLDIRRGERLCVVGPTGAGKSTLLSLLVRLYDPDDGVVRVDDVDLRACTLGSVRERMGLVPQDPWILDGTIADNIAFGRPGATRAEIERVAAMALVDEFAARLPDGYETRVGESGTRLSGGQRRRIALARALLRDVSVLLLDEPTSGLDAASEAEVMAAIRQATANRTCVIVTHRLALTRLADRVVVLDGGRVVEEGEPEALIASDRAFARLWALQQGGEPVPAPLLHSTGT